LPVEVNSVAIKQLLNEPKGPVGKRLLRTGVSVVNRAKRHCPVDTGRLRSSITTTQPVRRSEAHLVIRVGSNVSYARFVEVGTRFMRGRRYLSRALREEFA